MICAYLGIVVYNSIINNGLLERATVSATVGDEKINSAEMNYYYIDTINNVSNQYGEYAASMFQMMGMDMSKPLDEQIYDKESNKTWADYFMDLALERAKRDYVLSAAAEKAGFKLTEEEKASLKNVETNLDMYAAFSSLPNGTAYLRSMYGNSANISSYVKYLERNMLAENYYAKYSSDLNFDDAAISEQEGKNPLSYNAYDFEYYHVDYTKYLDVPETTEPAEDETPDTTEDVTEPTVEATEPTEAETEPTQEATEPTEAEKTESEKKEYTEEEIKAAQDRAKEIADQLAASENFEEAVAALEVAGKKDQKTTHSHYTAYSKVNEAYQEWISDASRKEGDIAVFENKTTTTDADGKETTELKGYYVVRFESMTKNEYEMSDVRHLLVAFGNEDGEEVTDEMKTQAKEEAEKLLKQWKDGEATEDSFSALVATETDDEASAQTGGLYERVYEKSSYVEPFLNWCIAAERKAGDTEIVETEYGYHIMYFVKRHEENYRTYTITEELRSAALEKWYNGLMEPVTATVVETKYLPTDMVLGQ